MVIALLTDFGLEDAYVGIMKGVMQRILPTAMFIDITHQIRPQQVRQAAFVLMNSYRYFPDGTVFLVVVDPGVGSTRRAIAVQGGGYTFIAPDNGVLSYTLMEMGDVLSVEITDPDYMLPEISHSFHGRDIFAPAAAHVANGVGIEELGERVHEFVQLPLPGLWISDHSIRGEIVDIDRFGNLITSVGHLHWQTTDSLSLTPAFGDAVPTTSVDAARASVKVGSEHIQGIQTTFAGTAPGYTLAMVGSSGFLEIAVNQGSAASRLGAAVGDLVEVNLGESNAAVYH